MPLQTNGGEMSWIKFCSVLILAFIWSGCTALTDVADSLPNFKMFEIGATEYEIDMSRSDISALEKELAMNIYPMDTQLTSLLRTLSVRDTYPPLLWKQKVISEFFWLNQITVLDKDQKVISRYPETSIKQLSYDPAFPEALSLSQGKIMLAIEDTELGSEVLIISSVFHNFELTGFIVATFDPRTFISQSNKPEDIILISAEEIVWTGKFEQLESHLERIQWEEMVSRRISGKVKLDQKHFFWFARGVGEDWLIYLIKE